MVKVLGILVFVILGIFIILAWFFEQFFSIIKKVINPKCNLRGVKVGVVVLDIHFNAVSSLECIIQQKFNEKGAVIIPINLKRLKNLPNIENLKDSLPLFCFSIFSIDIASR